jgi:superfamily II DNA or RNA helicase
MPSEHFEAQLIDDLLGALGSAQRQRLSNLGAISADSQLTIETTIAAVVLLEAGGSLLKARRVIRQLLKTVDKDILKECATSLASRSYEKPYDNAIVISKLDEPILADVLMRLLPEQIVRALRSSGVEYADESPKPAFAAVDAKQLLPHQESVVQKADALIKQEKSFLVQMPTGSGKTTTAIMLLIRSGLVREVVSGNRFAFWLAPTKELVSQAMAAFQSLWARYGDGVAYVHDARDGTSQRAVPHGAITFATFQASAAWNSSGRAAAYGRDCGFVVADEAHRAIAPTYREALEALTRRSVRIGLTATPGRQAELSVENVDVAKFFDTNVVRATESRDEIGDLQSQGVLSQLARTVVEVGARTERAASVQPTAKKKPETLEDTEHDLGDIPEKTLRQLADDDRRNGLIMDTILDRVTKGHRVIFFACSVEHSRFLSAVLLLRGVSAASIDAVTSPARRDAMVEKFKNGELQVLGNYTVFSAGFDAPGTDVVVITRPTSSIVTFSQMIGRALRGPRMGGAKKAEVIQFSDAVSLEGSSADIYNHFERYWLSG